MSTSAKYDPTEIEDKWYDFWMENDLFRSVPDEREPYTIVIPPPNVTGILHMGHMLNNTIQDVLIRRKRMQGYNTCWVPGTDHASIATESKVVAMLAEQGIDKKDLTREEFLVHAMEWKEKYGGIILKQLRKMGASCDWERTHFTMDPDYYKSVIKVFCDLYDKGYIYRGARMVNWDPKGLTALSDEEVIRKEVDGKLYYVRYKIEGTEDEYITVATTRPETILGDTAIAVHPEDERYTHLLGKKALVPLIERPIPIIADDYIDKEFGTGCLKVTPAHDINDYEIGLRHNLETIDTLNEDGTLSEAAQLYIGQDRFDVRKQISKDLKEAGHLIKTEDIKHNVGFSERTNAVVEPRISTQWFVKMEELVKPAGENVENGNVKLIPEKFKNTYNHWINNIQNWCISRQLWWGHRIPAWYLPDGSFVVAEDEETALAKAIERSGNNDLTIADLKQDDDVLDTWFSSWLWPMEVFKGISSPDNEEINYYYPTNDLVTAPEILFFWVARMIIAGYEYKGEKPFDNVYLTGIVRDKQRRKMSKSLGNSPDPLELFKEYGADGLRVGMLLAAPAGNDLLFDISLVEQGRNFANKIWNAYRLVSGWETEDKQLSEVDRIALNWMDCKLNAVKTELADHFEKFRISDALMTTYKFAWDDFFSSFLEMVKPPYGEKISSVTYDEVIDHFEELLMLVHPFMPFITEELFQGLRARNGDSICTTQPEPIQQEKATSEMLGEVNMIQEVVTAIRKVRIEKGIKNKDEIELIVKTSSVDVFKKYQAILTKFLNTSSITFTEDRVDGAVSTMVRTHELFVPLTSTNIDVEAEVAKLKKDLEYQQGFLNTVNKKLGNERFVNNAPVQVVENERKKQRDAEEKIAKLEDSLKSLMN